MELKLVEPAEQLQPDQDGNSGTAYSFVIRVWVEGQWQKEPVWRGSIEDVGSGKRLYFNEPSGIERFLCEQTGIRWKRGNKLREIFASFFHPWK